jgi:hypothetical protein
MIESEEIVGGEWAEWYRLTPLQRWHASGELWEHYLQIGGSLDPERGPYSSPFLHAVASRSTNGWQSDSHRLKPYSDLYWRSSVTLPLAR